VALAIPTEHELAHHFQGDTQRMPTSFADANWRETLADTRVNNQNMNFSQSAFREGLEPRRYASEANPEANKPQH
jgi:hypothetical protein